MQNLLKAALFLLIGLLGGLLGATLLHGGSEPADGASQSGTGLDAVSATAFQELAERVMLLERSADAQDLALEEFDGRLLSLGRREQPAGLAAEAQPGAAASDAGLALAEFPVGPGFDAAVVAALERREAEERAEREQQRVQRRDARLTDVAQQLATEAGLDSAQQNAVLKVMKETAVARETYFEQMQRGGDVDREAARAKMTEIRQAEVAAVSAVLTPAQMQVYTRLTESGRDFGGRAGRDGQGGGGRGDF